jgi:hypothetical protein
MVARSLADYDVRLRYYIVQSIKPRRGFKRCPKVPIERFKEQIHAVQDWENADCELIRRTLNLYDPEDWTAEERASVEKVMNSGETLLGRSFSTMIEYLRENEAKILGVFPRLRDVDREYRNIKPNWNMQSAFLHGSQAIVTDVLEHVKGTRTGTVFRHAPGNFSRTILFTAITHMVRLIHSFSMLRGWAFGDFQFEKALPGLWFSWSPEAVF